MFLRFNIQIEGLIRPNAVESMHNLTVVKRIHIYIYNVDVDENLLMLTVSIEGPRETYLEFGVPLYEASIKCDWKAAKVILDKRSDLVRYSITENGETALHVAASAQVDSKLMIGFVKNLVTMMSNEQLMLQNKNHNTALYLAAAGNVEITKIMMGENRVLLTTPGANGSMMPLYAAALFGQNQVVKYLYKKSRNLSDDGWNPMNRGWLLEKCVENNMFGKYLYSCFFFLLQECNIELIMKIKIGTHVNE